ncbi:hypothetical protein [Bacillus sp. FJAT-45037]|uniref:hypothetical protein n=1 Tax=Bacillus sp. FJAT-45037 TaxID=2011007 RepID=UPI000C236EED|nr:hypothetical protein [Bacillus sp. FJAT-45037]
MEHVTAIIKKTSVFLLNDQNGVGILFIGGVCKGRCSFELTRKTIELYKDRTYVSWQLQEVRQAYNWNGNEPSTHFNVLL